MGGRLPQSRNSRTCRRVDFWESLLDPETSVSPRCSLRFLRWATGGSQVWLGWLGGFFGFLSILSACGAFLRVRKFEGAPTVDEGQFGRCEIRSQEHRYSLNLNTAGQTPRGVNTGHDVDRHQRGSVFEGRPIPRLTAANSVEMARSDGVVGRNLVAVLNHANWFPTIFVCKRSQSPPASDEFREVRDVVVVVRKELHPGAH